jgi:hypothetical protein
MTNEKSNPHADARYGVAMTAGLGFYDTAGWAPTVMPLSDGGVRRDYGPQGCAGQMVVGAVLIVAAVALTVLMLCGVI